MQNKKTDIADKTIGENIRMTRLKKHITLTDAAKYLNLSYQHVAAYESGRTRIPAKTLFYLSILFEEKIETFFEGV